MFEVTEVKGAVPNSVCLLREKGSWRELQVVGDGLDRGTSVGGVLVL